MGAGRRASPTVGVRTSSAERNAYERVRADPLQFAMAPGHEDPSVEAVITREKSFHLVRKHEGEPGALAAERDPRGS